MTWDWRSDRSAEDEELEVRDGAKSDAGLGRHKSRETRSARAPSVAFAESASGARTALEHICDREVNAIVGNAKDTLDLSQLPRPPRPTSIGKTSATPVHR